MSACRCEESEQESKVGSDGDERPALTVAAGLHGSVAFEGCLGPSCK